MTEQNKYTPEELETIRKEWRGGAPPAMCRGKCKVRDLCLIGLVCSSCGWGDDVSPVDNNLYND